jgi:hypothetical protein
MGLAGSFQETPDRLNIHLCLMELCIVGDHN